MICARLTLAAFSRDHALAGAYRALYRRRHIDRARIHHGPCSNAPGAQGPEAGVLACEKVHDGVAKTFLKSQDRPEKAFQVRLLHMSDIHFGAENASALAAATSFLRSRPYDLLVLTGDLTQFGRHDEFAAAKAWLMDLQGPTLATPGNHDTPWLGIFERVSAPFQRFAKSIGPPDDVGFEGVGFTARAINSARGWQFRLNWSKGHISRRQVAIVIRRFGGAGPCSRRVLACHHPLVEAVGEPMTGLVRGGDFAAANLVAAGVDLVLTGHTHAPFVQPLPHGDAMTYAVGAGTLSMRERGARPGFNVIETVAEEMTVTAMAFDGRLIQVDRTWQMPLRRRAGEGS